MNWNVNNWVETWKQVANTWWEHLLNNPFVAFVLKLFLAIVVVWVLAIVSKIIAKSVKNKIIKKSVLNDDEYIDKIWALVWDVIYYTLLTFSIFIWFEILWFDVWILLWGLSFWIWLAFKEILWNMLAGILILTTKDYTLGDVIKVESSWYFWYIEEITIRYTIIREFNNQRVIVPNLSLIISPIKTFSSEEFIRLETIVSVHYNTDLDKAKKILIEAVNNNKIVVNKDWTTIITDKFADSGIDLKVLFYIDPNAWIPWYKAISIINDDINKALKKNNITIPYPHTVLSVDQNDQNLLKTILFSKKK